MHITTLGIDLAKNVFQLHGVDARGQAVLQPTRARHQLMEVGGESAALCDRDGGVRECASLGPSV
jgi:hypothetical protein